MCNLADVGTRLRNLRRLEEHRFDRKLFYKHGLHDSKMIVDRLRLALKVLFGI